MKKLLILFTIFISFSLSAQESIQVKPEYKKNIPYNFNNEWHYLSSDLYFFNAEKFDVLINAIYEANQETRKWGRKKSKNKEKVQGIFVTAKILGTSMDEKLVYPLYSFKVDKNDKGYKTYTSSSSEVIRVIDNLPLSSVDDFIGAKVDVEILTDKKNNRVYEIIADQLELIAQIKSPTSAAMTLVGELGKVIKSRAKGKEYHFESTIRLYEEQDFNKRLHSVSIFTFLPASEKTAYIDTTEFFTYLDTAKNPVLDRSFLLNKVRYYRYPFMIIANYKSKYISAPVVGDEVDFESIEARHAKVKNAFENGLLTKDIYIQELRLIEFLNKFAKLKMEINNYELNHKNKITDDFTRMFLIVLKDYRTLKNIYRTRLLEFSNDKIFKNEFQAIYESILTNAELYLEKDNNLKNIKELVGLTYNYTNKLITMQPDSTTTETHLRTLYSVRLPKDEEKSEEIIEINMNINRLEQLQYNRFYKSKVEYLKSTDINEQSIEFKDKLKKSIKTTNCKLCRENVNNAISTFNKKLEMVEKMKILNETDRLIKKSKDEVFYILVQESCLQKHFDEDYPDGFPAYIELMYDEFKLLKQTRKKLQEKLDKDIKSESLNEIQEFNLLINNETQKMKNIYKGICEKVPSLCDCNQ